MQEDLGSHVTGMSLDLTGASGIFHPMLKAERPENEAMSTGTSRRVICL